MFDHVSIGVSDIKRAGAFYDAALKPLGYTRLVRRRELAGLRRQGRRAVALARPRQPVKADLESGLHFCFAGARAARRSTPFMPRRSKAGGKDNGKPGVRADYSPKYYARLRHRSRRLSDRGLLRQVGILRGIGSVATAC